MISLQNSGLKCNTVTVLKRECETLRCRIYSRCWLRVKGLKCGLCAGLWRIQFVADKYSLRLKNNVSVRSCRFDIQPDFFCDLPAPQFCLQTRRCLQRPNITSFQSHTARGALKIPGTQCYSKQGKRQRPRFGAEPHLDSHALIHRS